LREAAAQQTDKLALDHVDERNVRIRKAERLG
jgi:hypothetical protein